jgi:hypothetical protein
MDTCQLLSILHPNFPANHHVAGEPNPAQHLHMPPAMHRLTLTATGGAWSVGDDTVDILAPVGEWNTD